jgi:hypothetical protein
MKTYNSIDDTALFIKVTRRANKIVGVYTPPRHSETNIFLAAIRMDYLPSELGHIVCALQSYRYDVSLILTTPARLAPREEHAMGIWWIVFDAAVLEYIEDTLPSENVEYWNSIRDMAAHAHAVLTRMRNLVA